MNFKNKKTILSNFFMAYNEEMLSYAINKLNNKEIAQDLVQETFLSAFEGFESFNKKSSSKTWLYGILNKKIADHFRRLQRIVNSKDYYLIKDNISNENTHPLDSQEFLGIYKKALISLPKLWRKILFAKYIENIPSFEICKKYAITKENYWQIIHRSKEHLKKHINTFHFFNSK